MTTRKKRPRDFAQRAKVIVDIATGEIEDREPTPWVVTAFRNK